MDNFSKEEIEKATLVVQRFKKKKSKDDVFYNLCFCILVPQTKFKTVLQVVEKLKQASFFSEQISRETLLAIIAPVRFKNRKADYLLRSKYKFDIFWKDFEPFLESASDSRAKRNFVIGRIKGMGLKAASHFLRNLGVNDLAIVDVHILKHLNISDKSFDYFSIEDEIRARANRLNVSVAIYDALVWGQRSGTDASQFIY